MKIYKRKSIPLWVVIVGANEVWSGAERTEAYQVAHRLLRNDSTDEVTVERRQWTTLSI